MHSQRRVSPHCRNHQWDGDMVAIWLSSPHLLRFLKGPSKVELIHVVAMLSPESKVFTGDLAEAIVGSQDLTMKSATNVVV